MNMKFMKVHGLGNDFILVDGRHGQQPDFNAIAPALCKRRTGIGADGIIVVLPSDVADIRMRVINSNGSEAEMCGNAIRCFSKYVYENKLVDRTEFSIETLAGIMLPELLVENGVVTKIRVNMGEPIFDAADVPVEGEGTVVDREFTIAGQKVRLTCMRVGVPHTVLFVDDLATTDIDGLGAAIECAEVFPAKTNVNFVHVINRHVIEVRTFERGCGRTLACGTGSTSSVVACVLNGKTSRSVDVHIELGTLHIEWAADNHLYMTGPAELNLFTGEIEV